MEVLFLRGSQEMVDQYVGALGKLVLNTDKMQFHLQDGETPGGVPLPIYEDIKQLQATIEALDIPNIEPLVTALASKIGYDQINQAGGVAGVGVDGKIPATLLPSYMDEISEYASFAEFPEGGDGGTIYVALDTGDIYRWSGSQYTAIAGSPGTTDDVSEGSQNLYFTQQRARMALQVSGSLEYDPDTGTVGYTESVSSVAGKTGDVALDSEDVGLGLVVNQGVATEAEHVEALRNDVNATPLGTRRLLESIGFQQDAQGNWTLDQGTL